MFYISAAFYVTGIAVFAYLVSGEVQTWAMDEETHTETIKKKPADDSNTPD